MIIFVLRPRLKPKFENLPPPLETEVKIVPIGQGKKVRTKASIMRRRLRQKVD